ncbi:hypothetical protein [Segetibacter koreensis]|uniref:hypothetical protein n=1 Tax=Segetibacter koreensis TaxID=398037 RepID=UPI000377EA49|nr:hypothetical protein [Segetibacter koreensis]
MANKHASNKSIHYLDRILPLLPANDPFMVSEVIVEKFGDAEKSEANDLSERITELLVDDLKYADDYHGRLWLKLTDKGRLAQEKGGHFKYQSDLDENDRIQRRLSDLDNRLKEAQLKLTLQQSNELKNKKLWAILGAIGGSLLTIIVTNAKDILEALRQYFHI